MQGHGYAQPSTKPPPTVWLVFLRVLFVVISVFSIGFLAWTMMLRLAIVTRKGLDWGLLVAVLAADTLSLVLLGSEPGEEIHTAGGYTGLTLLLGTLVVVISYYLAADVRHFHRLRYAYAPQQQPRTPAYGYPGPRPPYAATTVPQASVPAPPISRPQVHPVQPVQPPVPSAPPQQRPAPARIDQVRAELDELSDYLRKHDSNHDGNHEGGR